MKTEPVQGMYYPRLVLYDVEWQCLRVSLLSRWTGDDNVKTCLAALDAYASAVGAKDARCRTWRVLNLLNAVLLAYGSQEKSRWWPLVRAKRDYYSKKHAAAGALEPNMWDPEKVLEDLGRVPLTQLKAVRQNLGRRLYTAKYRGHDANKTRPELMWFVGLLDGVIQAKERLHVQGCVACVSREPNWRPG